VLFWVRQYFNIFEIYAYGCNLVYDVSNRDTFDALNTWWNEVNTYCSSPDVVKMIVGNKVDKVILVRIKKKIVGYFFA
jgi:GTPase SAR1 family protein